MKNYFLCLVCLFTLLACRKEEKEKVSPEPPVPKVPVVITHPYTDLTRFSIKITGAVTDTGGSKIIEAGFVVDTATGATIQKNLNKFLRVPDAQGQMLAIITDIPADKTYYLRAYAKNSEGVAYGNEINFTAFPEKVYKGMVTLATQQEVIDFGSKQYTRIDGTLELTGTVTDLSPLKHLSAINYALNVRYTKQLVSLKGLDSLEAVNASLFHHGMRIEGNAALKSLEGLNKLYNNDGYLYILNNDELTDLNGLNNLSYSFAGELRIEGCDKIRTLHGLEKLGWLYDDLMLKDNPLLTDITALSNLGSITGRIRVINNASLQNLNGLQKLHKLEGLEIYDNKSLSDLKGLENLDTITSIILLRNNAALKEVLPLQKIAATEYLTIENSPALSSLEGFRSLKNVKYKILLRNTGLINLRGLENIVSAQSIDISYNEQLQSLEGLNNLAALVGSPYSLGIGWNPQLTSLTGLEKLKEASGSVAVAYNRLLKDYCGLKPLLSTGWNKTFTVEGNSVNPTITDVLNSCP